MDIHTLGKDELAEVAKNTYGVTLDKRKKLVELRLEVAKLVSGKAKTPVVEEEVPVEQDDLISPESVVSERVFSKDFVLNKKTGVVFQSHAALEKKVEVNDDFVFCDKDGQEFF